MDGSTVKFSENGISEMRQELTSAVSEMMKHFRIPGVSIAIADGNRISSYAFGCICEKSKDLISEQTLFQAGSISKGTTALLCLALVKKGLISLDEEISASPTEDNVVSPEFPAPTIREVLCHSAGFNIHGFRGYSRGSSIPEISQILKGVPPSNNSAIRACGSPRSFVRYSGGGYVALQYSLMRKFNLPFEELADAYLFAPTQCLGSTFRDSPGREYAAGHSQGALLPREYDIYPQKAAAGLWTCPVEILQLLMQIREAILDGESRILTRYLAEQMLLPHNDQFCLGFRVKGSNERRNIQIHHGGVNNGYDSYLHLMPYSGKAAVIMTNSNSGMAGASAIFRAVSKLGFSR